MKKGKKVYVLVEWLSNTYAEYTLYYDIMGVYFNRPYFKTLEKAKKVYGYYWSGENWPHCEILTFANENDYINGEDPINYKTYYK